MPNYYLRMEAVNLDQFVYDTQNLSTIRGGSLLLLYATAEVKNQFGELKNISTGASIGLFEFESENVQTAAEKLEKVQNFLINHDSLKEATFVVDVQQKNGDFLFDREAVSAKNHWRQFQQPTVVIPEKNTNQDIKSSCLLDMIRPGVHNEVVQNESMQISTSTAARLDYGRKMKQRFYSEILGSHGFESIDTSFVYDFESLATDPDKGYLNGKMAVIYLDGNKFTDLRDRYCRESQSLNEFDQSLKSKQAGVLAELLSRMGQDREYQTQNGQFRLETLLWGGDELIWVVPAWKGWNVLKWYFFNASSWQFAEQPLTFAGGLVFCHHKAPIHRMVGLCQTLADTAKKVYPLRNSFQYLALESFDHIGDDLGTFRSLQCPALTDDLNQNEILWRCTLFGEQMQDIADLLHTIKSNFPRGQVYKAISAANKTAKMGGSYWQDFMGRLKEIFPKEKWMATAEMFSDNPLGSPESPGMWLNIAQLWDYIPEQGDDL